VSLGYSRYKCNACGNLTRFDVVIKEITKSYFHYSIAGELTIEENEILEREILSISCRWCGHGNQVEPI
jgi:hypothetical protein